MKKIHIIGMLMIGIAIYLIATAGKGVATYSSFDAPNATIEKVKVVGNLVTDKPVEYDAQKDPNYFSFYMVDKKGNERKVIMHQGKPNDFELSESIVLTGKIEGEDFVASDMLLKCPSKYKDEEIYLKSERG